VYDAFCAALTVVASRRLVESPTAHPILEIDAELNLDHIDTRLVQTLQQFAPFGIGNNEPTFLARGVIVLESLGMGATQNHTRLTLQQSDRSRPLKFVAFFSKLWQRVERGMRVDVVFQLGTNEWNGRQEIECKIIDLKPV
jgi:single-stranded-DNA-specific exonuclease